ncbi:type II toxin-antitoxin system RelE/ParE family toxin [Nocardiopsis algeriensis]|uniref:Phage-related protein n=1 Tax=Nocardiopsis algeriensis TaxID=1478215 RepID=A0A841IS40_9ACTN|nr:phage-related protein [Nocardiopsis algeriensis]
MVDTPRLFPCRREWKERALSRWETFTSSTGNDLVRKEIARLGLGPHEQQKLKRVMGEKGRGRDLGAADKPLSGYQGMRELVVRCGDRSFRLVYANVSGGLVLLALHFFVKKSRTAHHDLEVAWARLKDWHRRHPQGP